MLLAVHRLAPSKAIPTGPWPVGNVPSTAPSQSRSFITLLLPRLDTHRFVPGCETAYEQQGETKRCPPLPALERTQTIALFLPVCAKFSQGSEMMFG